jgi:hypothetical protein
MYVCINHVYSIRSEEHDDVQSISNLLEAFLSQVLAQRIANTEVAAQSRSTVSFTEPADALLVLLESDQRFKLQICHKLACTYVNVSGCV